MGDPSSTVNTNGSAFGLLKKQFLSCYEELRNMAHVKLRYEYAVQTLDTTALVHEVYLKLDKQSKSPENKDQFLAIAAIAMRRYLIDYARQKQREKRGGNQIQLTYGAIRQPILTTPEELVRLDEALTRLKRINHRHSRVVDFHFFGGYKHEEIAGMLEVSIDTVRRDWRLAKAWLTTELRTK